MPSSAANTPIRPRPNKRARSPSRVAPSSSPQAGPSTRRLSGGSDLPPSSPPQPFSDTDDSLDDRPSENEIQEPDDDVDAEGEDLFGDNLMEDYAQDERLDRYSEAGIDDQGEVDEISAAARRRADAMMDRRDRNRRAGRDGRAARRARAPGFLDSDDMADDDEDGGLTSGLKIRTRRDYDERRDIDDAAGIEDDELPLEDLSDIKANSVAEWIATEPVRKAIARFFREFLMEFTDKDGASVYGARIDTLGQRNAESLEVSYEHLANTNATIAFFLANCPAAVLSIFDSVALDVIILYYPSYDSIHSEVHVRITDFPVLSDLRELRRSNLNKVVRVKGVVTRRTGVFPQLKYDASREVRVSFCPNCEGKGPFTVNSEQTVYRNYQKMTLQESPGSVPAGRLPRHREVILLWDLIDTAKPGEEVEVTGIYRNNFDASLNSKNGFPVFSTIIEANHLNKKEDSFAAFRLTQEDERLIRQMARDDRIRKRIVKSIAPSIYGHDDIKTAIALSLFGGVPKDINGKHNLRGDINILLLGDPGTAKSQFLKYVEKTAQRAVFTTGQGASAVGLTASVRKDPVTREWTLEGGALVLADRGTCLIDEFDKMNDHDRTSIHEAMEQQTISISKAGIVTTLKARCAIVAAANPVRGRYNPTIPFQQNVELTEPILSRFDVLCVVKDTVDPVKDELLAKFVTGSHLRSHPAFDEEDEVEAATALDEDIIPQEVLRKYIMYARDKIHPKLHNLDQDKLAQLFADLRRESLSTGSFPITVRHLESMIRMSEASAKMHLREFVRADDIDLAISVTVGSFVNAQKLSIKKTLERGFRKYLSSSKDHEEVLSFILGQLIKEKVQMYQLRNHAMPDKISILVSDLEERAKEHEIYSCKDFVKSKLFSTNGYRLKDGDRGKKKVNSRLKVDGTVEERYARTQKRLESLKNQLTRKAKGDKLSGKVCVVTGVGSMKGIGYAQLSAKGDHTSYPRNAHADEQQPSRAAHLYLLDFAGESLPEIEKTLMGRYPATKITTIQGDASDDSTISSLCQRAITEEGRLDVFFANAGIASANMIQDITPEAFLNMMKVNVLSCFLAVKHGSKAMMTLSKSKEESGGSIIVTASVAGLRSGAGTVDYSASKAAVNNLAKTAACQLAGTNIRVNSICPGLIETGMTGMTFDYAKSRGTTGKIGQLAPLQRYGIAEEVAQVALFLACDDSSYVTAQNIAVDGG
ncbi:MCM DNA helicase complex subunit [Tulasnella sp. 331]|nr:MCM DNA helicase complex subunit [Tulasnella sp. 331]